MPSLGDIDKEQSSPAENPDVFLQEIRSLRLAEMLEEPLMENHVERTVAKRERKRIAAQRMDRRMLFPRNRRYDPDRIFGVIELIDYRAAIDQAKAVAARPRADL